MAVKGLLINVVCFANGVELRSQVMDLLNF